MESKEHVPGKGITEYVVSNATTGTSTTFTQPEGTQNTAPTFANEFGTESTQLKAPLSSAADSTGNVWVTDTANNRLEKFSPAGVLIGTYGSLGTAGGQFNTPWGVTVNQSTGHVYVTDQANFRIEEFTATGVFVKAIGWGVNDGKAEPEVCETGCRVGLAGSGDAQFSTLAGLTLDSSGNLWIADYGNNRVQELSAAGGFLQKFGTEGTANGQFKGPLNIAFSGGKVYVTDYGNNRVQKFSTAGAYESKFGEAGTSNGKFSGPYGIASDPVSGNLLVVDSGNARVQAFNSAGTFLAKFGTYGAGAQQLTAPTGIALSQAGIYIVDHGTSRVEEWTHPTWLPTISDGPLPSDTTTYSYEAAELEEKTVIRPTEALAPPPTGITCGTKPAELKKGCRALTFEYATSTTATGENRSEWNDYKGRLKKIYFHAYNPATKAMEEPAVSQYSYDKQGRLRAEWDPRITPSLKTSYGYDSEGHITALTPPGQESWAFVDGAIVGDPNPGRLLKVTRAPASASLWNGEAPKNTETPKLTGTPTAGVALGVSQGLWSNSPVVYDYQWQDCNVKGEACVAIPGATNPNYKLTATDTGHTVAAAVTAINGDGSATATVLTTTVAQPVPTFSSRFEVPGGSTAFKPQSLARDTHGKLWAGSFSLSGNLPKGKTEVFSEAGALQFSTTVEAGVNAYPSSAIDAEAHIWTTTFKGKVLERNESGTVLKELGALGTAAGQMTAQVQGVAISPITGNLYIADRGANRIEEFTQAGSFVRAFGWGVSDGASQFEICTATCQSGIVGSGNGQFNSPVAVAIGTGGTVWVSEGANNRIEAFSEAGEYRRQVGGLGSAPGQFNQPSGIAAGPRETIWAVDRGNHRVQILNEAGEYLTQFGSSSSFAEVSGIAVTSSWEVWLADIAVGQPSYLEKWSAPAISEGTNHTAEPGTTLEYHLPVSGTGLPTLTKAEVEKWGQKTDFPSEGMAVIPPDEPQGWPAATYKRATIDYMDELGRTVNTSVPTGGISTTEYNEVNEVTRTLTANDRAAALKETGKTAEAAEKLDTQTFYNAAKSQVTKVVGPQHKVKLSSGSEVQARGVTHDYYDEGAPSGKTYNLLTKTTVGAEYEGKEADVRTTLTSYSGQGTLGWTLRRPTSITADPSGLDLITKTVYDENTGNVVESRSPGGNSETVYPPSYASTFGGEGSGNGQLKLPGGGAFDASGNLWVPDAENNRVEEFSPSGAFIKTVGWGVSDGKPELQVCTTSCKAGLAGTGNGEFKGPRALTTDTITGNVYVADTENNRVEELSSAGAYVATIGTSGSGALQSPEGVALDGAGDLWVADTAHNRVAEFNPSHSYLREVASAEGPLKGPIGIAFAEGTVFVVDAGNSRVVELTPIGVYIGQFGSQGSGTGQFKEPFGIAANPSTGTLYVADLGNKRVQEFSPAGRYLTSWETWGPSHVLSNPVGLAVAATGKLYISDLFGSKITTWTPPETGAAHLSYASKIGSLGSGTGQLSTPIDVAFDGAGDKWVSDLANNRIEEFSPSGAFIKTVGWGVSDGKSEAEVCTSSCKVGLSGSGNGQFNGPGGIDVNQSTGNVYVADTNNARIEELSAAGSFIAKFGTEGTGKLTRPGSLKIDSTGNVWVPDMSLDKIFEYTSSGAFIAVYGKEGTGEVAFKDPVALAFAGENVYIADAANHRVQEITNKGVFVRNIGIEGPGSGELYDPEGIAADAAGNLYVVDNVAAHVEEFSSSGAYMATFATRGSGSGEEQLKGPKGDAIDTAGNLYVVDSENNRVQKWSSINQRVHYTKTIYYTAAPNGEYEHCGEHAEWANLPCFTKPVAQPSDAPPSLPETEITYNIWDEALVKTEKLGSSTRTTTQTYDAAGRAKTSEETSTAGATLPLVTNEYSEATGALVKQTTAAGKTSTSVFNKRGQLESYTDADSNTSKYVYDEDGRVQEMSDGKGSQIYVHDPTTGLLTELFDTAAGKFKATYNVEGNLLTQSYPNGMTASYTNNSLGQPTQVEYVKTTHCSSNCTWFSDAIVPSIDGEIRSQTSTLATESYNYDGIGRLTKVQETPAGQGCTTRVYTDDEESNRTGLTTSGPGTEGKCSEEGATTERHLYDEANRLIDAGTTYDALGNATSLPAADAGGHAMTDTYYVDNQVHTQTQNEETVTYAYDPEGRTREAVSTGKTSNTVISHYSGPGGALAWTSESPEAWSRNIPGIDGTLDAIQPNGGAPILQIHDLQGNIVATAALSETETKLLSTYNSTEFGVPQPGTTPPKYAWLGATGLSTEQTQASGTSTQDGESYVPQLAHDLQTAPVVPPGAFPNGQGTGAAYGSEIPGWYIKLSEEQSAATLAEFAARQQAMACEANPASCIEVADPAPKMDNLSVNEAATIAYTIRQLLRESKESTFVEFFFALKDFAEETLEGLFTGDASEKWDEALADGLEQCVSFFDWWKFNEGGCLVETPTVGILGGKICAFGKCVGIPELVLPDLNKTPSIYECGEWVYEGPKKFLTECIS